MTPLDLIVWFQQNGSKFNDKVIEGDQLEHGLPARGAGMK